jgi:carnosine N-methyltransferase
LLVSDDLKLSAGEFLGVYKDCFNRFDSVVTCFFIDAIENPFDAINLIFQLLKPGGIWINFGPLHLHQFDHEFFCPFTLEDLTKYSFEVGFELIEEHKHEATYGTNPNNHIITRYNCTLSVFRK